MTDAHKDPKLRRMSYAVVIIGLMMVAGAVGTWLARDEPVDLRWAEYQQPTIVGVLAEDGTVSRPITDMGIPVVDNDLVHVVFERCGPVTGVDVVSARTWVLTAPDDSFVGISGDEISATIGADGGCAVFELDYEIPDDVTERIGRFGQNCRTETGCRPTPIELRFMLTPNDPVLGPIVVTTEQFVRDIEYDGPVTIETVDLNDRSYE